MYKKLEFFPAEMIFYKIGKNFVERVRYDSCMFSDPECPIKPSADDLFSNRERPFASELHTAIARYETIVDEATAVVTACARNTNPIFLTTYEVAKVILSADNLNAISDARYNIFIVKKYLSSLDGTYKSMGDKYMNFLDHILPLSDTIFAYEPHSMPFSLLYDSTIATDFFFSLTPVVDTPFFKTGAYNVINDSVSIPPSTLDDSEISVLFPCSDIENFQSTYPIVDYSNSKDKDAPTPSFARLYQVTNLWEYIRATIDYIALQHIRLRKCKHCGRYYFTSNPQYCGDECLENASKKARSTLSETDKIAKRTSSMLRARISGYKPKPGGPAENYEDIQNLANFTKENSAKRRLYKAQKYRKEDYIQWLNAQHEAYVHQPKNVTTKTTKKKKIKKK